MNPTVKETLDLRLARGEISESEYHSLLKTISTSNKSGVEGVVSALFRAGTNATKAIDNLLLGKKADSAIRNRTPTNDTPLKVSKDFLVYGDYFSYKGSRIGYEQIVGLSFSAAESETGTLSGMPLWISYKTKLIIRIKNGSPQIDVRDSESIFSSLVSRAYYFIQEKTFRQRMAIYLTQLENPGFIDIDGVKLHRCGDVEKGGTRINLHDAQQKNLIQKGTAYGGSWTLITGSKVSGTNPNEIIVGADGLGLFSRRIKFEVDRDHDVLFSIIAHLSDGKRI